MKRPGYKIGRGFMKSMQHKNSCNNVTAGSFAYVGYNPNYKEIVASFRGSSDIPNWIEDIDAFFTPQGVAFPAYPTVQVEKGFYDYYLSMMNCVMPAVTSLQSKNPTYATYITGHSLGAAGASMCAMDFKVNRKIPVTGVINFGEPRLGNQAFSNLAQSNMPNFERMVNCKDCVPHLPDQSMGYVHEVQEVWETPNGGPNYKVCSPTNGEDPTCSDSVKVPDCADHTCYMGVACCSKPGPCANGQTC